MPDGKILCGKTSAVIEWEGVRRPVSPQTTVREGHPILAAHPELFGEQVPDFEWDPAPPEPAKASGTAAAASPAPAASSPKPGPSGKTSR